ncbi:MAG TPA: LacI family DNA-binding transcriptional regulator [Chloroflexia bacterium]|nr:LacI family DNA-binding transcriptional regulator [Chloroflexia bacterium]
MSITSQPRNKIGKKIPLAEIAQLAGVSPSTVSRVLNNKAQTISSEVQQRVMAAVAELSPDKELVRRTIDHVSLFTSWILDPSNDSFYTGVLTGIEAECKKQGIHFSYTHLDLDLESIDFILDKVNQNHIDGLIFAAPDNRKLLEDVIKNRLPAVVINSRFADLPLDTFLPDNFNGTSLAINYLIRQGHRRILHLSDLKRATIRLRLTAYRNALEEAGIEYDPKLVVKIGDISVPEAYEGMKNFLNSNPPDFTAVFCGNDLTAIGAMKALREANLRIPEDVSVVGFDDIAFAQFTDPPLTTVRVEREAIGAKALQGLIDRVNNPNQVPYSLEIACKLIERESVAPPSKKV